MVCARIIYRVSVSPVVVLRVSTAVTLGLAALDVVVVLDVTRVCAERRGIPRPAEHPSDQWVDPGWFCGLAGPSPK